MADDTELPSGIDTAANFLGAYFSQDFDVYGETTREISETIRDEAEEAVAEDLRVISVHCLQRLAPMNSWALGCPRSGSAST